MSAPPLQSWARGYLLRRLRYVDRGRDLARGEVDCWGFCMLVHREVFGVRLPTLLDEYGSSEDQRGTAAAIERCAPRFERVEGEREPGDLVLMRMASSKPVHVGVYAGAEHVLHFSAGGALLVPIDRDPWRRRVLTTHRPRREGTP